MRPSVDFSTSVLIKMVNVARFTCIFFLTSSVVITQEPILYHFSCLGLGFSGVSFVFASIILAFADDGSVVHLEGKINGA